MNFQNLTQVCVDEFGKDTAQWVGRYKRLLNRANRTVVNAKDWSFMRDFGNTFNTVDGTEQYTLTETNVKKLINLRISTDGYEKRVLPVNQNVFTQMYPDVDSTEKITPDVYYPQGRSSTYQLLINLYPIPDAVYAMKYDFVKEATDMTSDSDTPDFPIAYHDLLVDYVLWKSYQHVRDIRTAQEYQLSFRDGLRQMMGDYQHTESLELFEITYDGDETE